ncbi:MAG TPA: tRNA 2-selenouridine(34) synthase MnmH [Bacilli bacterium]|nr:tRNA 2-selenouridine(34) synthase MnmH [Bacilli bacterium]
MPFRDLTAPEIYSIPNRVLIDVRSPSEFAEGTIPGSVNVPLFTDEERVLIGTTYKQESPAAARRLAMMTVSPKIPQLVEQMEELMKHGELVIFCWRGGMRSYSACTFMDLLKYPVKRLKGGYRAYRQMVLEKLALQERLDAPLIVLHGLTGVGKTRILLQLKERGHQVLDLEKLANHRGSVFGAVGLGKPSNQKSFDSGLFEALRTLDPNRAVFMEAESKRIGRSVMPDWLEEAKHAGIHVVIEASMDKRVERLIEDYLPHDNAAIHTALEDSLQKIRKRFQPADYTALEDLFNQGDYETFTAQLLEQYYDPRYEHKLAEYEGDKQHINADDLDEAVAQLERLGDKLSDAPRPIVTAQEEELLI